MIQANDSPLKSDVFLKHLAARLSEYDPSASREPERADRFTSWRMICHVFDSVKDDISEDVRAHFSAFIAQELIYCLRPKSVHDRIEGLEQPAPASSSETP